MAKVSKRRGRYVLDYYDNRGKRQRQTLKKGTTKKKAKEKLREIEDQLSKGLFIPETKIPTFKKVAKDWLNHKKPNLRASTRSVYEGQTKNHFGEFEDLKVNRITTAKIEKFITDRQSQEMNILTLRKILVTLGQIMRYAVRHRYISHNPFTDAERPRRSQSESDKKPIRILNPVEINRLLGATENNKYRTIFRLAIMSGTRQGELLGLKW
jgi:integrase